MRKYDKCLVDKIIKKQYKKNIDGIDIIFKPIPDDIRKNVLDPRVLDVAKKKMEVHKNISISQSKGFSLNSQRYRPDKISYDLTTSKIIINEQLIPINNNHYINSYIYKEAVETNNRSALIFIHGGGYIAGSNVLYRNSMKYIAEQSKAIVIFPEYRLAPENPFPDGINDAWGTVLWVYNNADNLGVDRNRIFVAGDSAGGNFASACVIKDKQKIIKEVIELYPGCDSTPLEKISGYSWSYEMYPVISDHKIYAKSRIDRIKDGNDLVEDLYLHNKTTYKNPLVSPIYYEKLEDFPKTIIITAEYDYLRVSNDYFSKLLKNSGVVVENYRYLGCDHGFLDCIGIEPQAEEVCILIANELKK